MKKRGKVSLIYTFHNRYVFSRASIMSFKKYTNFNLVADIVAIDVKSSDGTQKLIRQQSEFRRVLPCNPGIVSSAMITGIQEVKGDYIIHIPNDLIFSEKWLDKVYDTYMYFRERANLVMLAFGETYPHKRKCGHHWKRKKGYGFKQFPSICSCCIAKRSIWEEFAKIMLSSIRRRKYGDWHSYQRKVKGRKGFIYPHIKTTAIDKILVDKWEREDWEQRVKNEPDIFQGLDTIDKVKYLIGRYEKDGWARKHKF